MGLMRYYLKRVKKESEAIYADTAYSHLENGGLKSKGAIKESLEKERKHRSRFIRSAEITLDVFSNIFGAFLMYEHLKNGNGELFQNTAHILIGYDSYKLSFPVLKRITKDTFKSLKLATCASLGVGALKEGFDHIGYLVGSSELADLGFTAIGTVTAYTIAADFGLWNDGDEKGYTSKMRAVEKLAIPE